MGRDTNKAAFAATGVLSLGLIFPASLTLSGAHTGTLTVDGTPSAYVTRAKTVAELLAQRGITVGPDDRTQPSLDTTLGETTAITVRHAIDVTFIDNGADTTVRTTADNVGELLTQENVTPSASDYVSPSPDTPLSPDMDVEYRSAVNVTLLVGKTQSALTSSAANVGALIAAQGLQLGPHDFTVPSIDAPLTDGMRVRLVRVIEWTNTERLRVPHGVRTKLDFTLAPGAQKVVAKGVDGLREAVVRYTQRDDNPPSREIVASRIIRAPHAEVVAEGLGEYASFAELARRGFSGTVSEARSALNMVATAYTAGCTGCSGITAIGIPAGHGIVAVDPRVIPLGTKLYIPGYGPAIAGDTGGAIIGNRIDLGFNSYRDAILFGRRVVAVYILN